MMIPPRLLPVEHVALLVVELLHGDGMLGTATTALHNATDGESGGGHGGEDGDADADAGFGAGREVSPVLFEGFGRVEQVGFDG